MNLPKRIDISTSSLVSLKAELSRKQEEITKAKALAQATFIHPVTLPKKQTIWTKKNEGVNERNEKDFEEKKEEEDVLKVSRAALEAKSKLYDQLSQSASYVDEKKFLVDFQQKGVNEQVSKELPQSKGVHSTEPEDDVANHSDEYSAPSDPEDDWLDYVDCLGRTRRCLRQDLTFVKEKDAKLFQLLDFVEDRKGSIARETDVVENDEPELLSNDMRREILRQKWEQQEELLKNKPDIHYQDILFDEARTHGVGYYSFSQDKTDRLAQQTALEKLRKETQAKQEVARSGREHRQQQLQARLKAARQRKCARLGIPFKEDEIEVPESSETTVKVAEETATSMSTKKMEVAWKSPSTRPWDVGKEGVKLFEEMSRDTWMKKKRTERLTEFSPPSMYKLDEPSISSAQSWSETPKPGLFFSSKKPKQTDVEVSMLQPIGQKRLRLICNGVEDIEEETLRTEITGELRRRTKIAPPNTFEYYGSLSNATAKQNQIAAHKIEDIEKSIAAGLKYLRQQVEEKEKKCEKGLLDII